MNLYKATNEPAKRARFGNGHGVVPFGTYQAWLRTAESPRRTTHAGSYSGGTSCIFDPHEHHSRRREGGGCAADSIRGRLRTHLGIRLILVNNKMKFTPERRANAIVPDPEYECMSHGPMLSTREMTRRTQASATRVLEALSKVAYLHRWLPSVSPYDFPSFPEVFLVVREHD